ncbi:MAG: hypothetical protein WD826_03800 [Actinomycetota bacterium]
MRRTDAEIGAVFPNRHEAEAAVDELYDAGVADDHLWRSVRSCRRMVLDDDMDRMVFRSIAHWIAICLPLGALAGVALAYLGQTSAGEAVTPIAMVAGAFGGFMAGIFFGAVAGVTRMDRVLYGHDRWTDVPLVADEMLVVTHTHGRDDLVKEVFTEHHGHLVDTPRAA